MPDNRLPKKGIVDSLIDINHKLKSIQRQLCCQTSGGLTQVSTLNSSSIIFTGDGTEFNPLSATIDPSGISVPTLYTSNGTINTTRTVTLNNDLIFNSPVQSTFEINLHNATPAAEMLFRIRNGGGDGGVIIQKGVTLDIDHLFMGQYGSELKIGDVIIKNVTSAQSLATDSTGKIIAGTTPITSTPNLLIAATNASGNIIDGSANVITRVLTGFTTVNSSILATDTILQGFNKAQGQLNQKIALNSIIAGFVVGSNTAVLATDTLLAALGKIQGQINARAPLASPVFTGNPTAPTPTTGDNDTSIATTAFVQQELTSQTLLKTDYKGGQSLFTADGSTTQFDIVHNLGATPSFFTLTTTEPIPSNLLNRTITFPDDNTMRLTYGTAPTIGENANYVWIVYK